MAGGAAVKNTLTFDEAWPILQEEAINKLIHNLELEGNHEFFTSEEYVRLYTVVCNVSPPKALSPEIGKLYDRYKGTFEDYISSKVLPSLREKENENLLRELLRRWNNHKIMSGWLLRFFKVVYDVSCSKRGTEVEKLYDQYKRTFEDYISSKVLPSLREKQNENLLRELLRRWSNHKIMAGWLSRFFNYLSRYYIPLKGLPSLVETSNLTFYNLVYGEIKDQVRDAIISLIDRGHEGERIDQAMVKQVQDIFREIGDAALENYAKDIEEAMVDACAKFYSRKALD